MSKKIELVQRVELIKSICRGRKVLHLGCTNHPYTKQTIESDSLLHLELEKMCGELYGFDYDQSGIDVLENLGVKNLYRADLEKLEDVELDETFEVIIAGEVIEHLRNPGKFLQGIQRFMNSETTIVITTINAYCGFRFLLYALRGKGGFNEPVHPDHATYYSYKTLKLAVERENLEVREFYFYDMGIEHRPFNPWYVNLTNDICVKFSPHLSDGVIAVCGLKTE